MWLYRQCSGLLSSADGSQSYQCYSGHGAGVNNHTMQDVSNVGPIPCGVYTILAPEDWIPQGPYCLALDPYSDNLMWGREGFMIHGDLIGHVGEQLASNGCIIADRAAREAVWNSGDHLLHVIPS